MLSTRLQTIAILLPLGLFVIYLGGIAYVVFIGTLLCLAAWEYVKLFHTGGLQPSGVLVVGGVACLILGRIINGLASESWLIVLAIFASMTYHMVAYERGRDQAGTDFGVSLAGILYFGCLGSYLVSLRDLPEGTWWLLMVLSAIWLADGGAFFIGRALGRHPLCPRLSPKKTWEGHLGGIVVGVVLEFGLAYAWRALSGPGSAIQPWHGAVIGLVLAIFAPLGDLGESMVKRQMGAKDSSNIFPGHGGSWDRMDSWLWAVAIGYYMIIWLFI